MNEDYERLTMVADELDAANARIAELEADRDHWRDSSVAEGKSKLAVRRELKAQESATQQLSAELLKANARAEAHEIDAKSAYRQRDEWKAKCGTAVDDARTFAAHANAAESEAATLREHLRLQTAALAEDLSAARSETASLRAELDEVRTIAAEVVEERKALRAELKDCRDNSATRLAYSEQYRAEAASLRQLSEVYANERDQAWRDLNNAERGLEAARELLIQTTDDGSLTEGWKSRRDVFLSAISTEAAWRERCDAFLVNAPAAPSRAICPHSGEMRTRSDGVEACINCGAAIYAPLIAPAAPSPKADARVTTADSAPSTHSTSSATSDPTRTDHERAVLEAEEAIPDGTLKWLGGGDAMSTSLQVWAKALLARREAKK